MQLDDGEVELRPFNVVIERGINHGWVSSGTELALLPGVLIEADPV